MKRFLLTISALMSLAFGFAPAAAAETYWKVDLATPSATQTARKFNLSFTTLSTVASDKITVQAYQIGAPDTLVGSKTTTEPYGDSGVFAVTVPADGVYKYYLKATNSSGGAAVTDTKTVTVDTTAPAPVNYLGSTRSGNTITVTFQVPITGGTDHVSVYSSTNSSFTANGTTKVGDVSVSPGQTKSFSFTVNSEAKYYTAVQAFDAAGNGSIVTGDPNVQIQTATGAVATETSSGSTALAGTASASTAGSDTGGSTGQKSNSKGSVNASGQSNTDKKNDNKVLGAKTTSSKTWWWAAGAAVAVIAAGYYWLVVRQGKSLKDIMNWGDEGDK